MGSGLRRDVLVSRDTYDMMGKLRERGSFFASSFFLSLFSFLFLLLLNGSFGTSCWVEISGGRSQVVMTMTAVD